MPEYAKQWRLAYAPLFLLVISALMATGQSSKPQPHPNRPAAGPEVTTIVLRPIKTSIKKYSCPAAFTLRGQIYTNGATKVKYTWVSSDGRTWPQHSVTFKAAGQQSVAEPAKFGAPGKKVDDSIQLSVLSPNAKLPKTIVLAFACAK